MNARIRNASTDMLLDIQSMTRVTLDEGTTTFDLDSLRAMLADVTAELDLRHRSTITEQQVQTPWSRPRRA